MWTVSLDIKLLGFVSGSGSIVHFTASGNNHGTVGDRMPGIWTQTPYSEFVIVSAINGDDYEFTTQDFPMNQWTTVEISQKLSQNSDYEYAIKIDNVEVFSIINTQPQAFSNVLVYASNPWHATANALIRNLNYDIGKC